MFNKRWLTPAYKFIMADKISLPKSGGGLVSYKDEYKSKFIFPPVIIVILIVITIIVEFLIHRLF